MHTSTIDISGCMHVPHWGVALPMILGDQPMEMFIVPPLWTWLEADYGWWIADQGISGRLLWDHLACNVWQ